MNKVPNIRVERTRWDNGVFPLTFVPRAAHAERWVTREGLMIKVILLVALAFLSGCATHATLSVMSQPAGAYITEKVSGAALGIAPVNSYYEATTLQKFKDGQGCYLVRGFEARWVSGARAATNESIRLCGSSTGGYSITVSRDPSHPDLEKDLQFAAQINAMLIQQQQAQAAKDAANAALFSVFTAAQQASTPVRCSSYPIGNSVHTTCK